MPLQPLVITTAQPSYTLVPFLFFFSSNNKLKFSPLKTSSYLISLLILKSAISLPQQLEHYKDYISRIQEIATSNNNANASSIISSGIYIVSAGSSDFIQNYYINPLLYKVQSPDDFSDLLILSYSSFIQVHFSPFICLFKSCLNGISDRLIKLWWQMVILLR